MEVCTRLELAYTASLYNQIIKYVQPILKDNSPRALSAPVTLTTFLRFQVLLYSSVNFSHQKQAFHKPVCIIPMKKKSAQLHRHCNKCFTRPRLSPSYPFTYYSPSKQSPRMFNLSPKTPLLLTLTWYTYGHSQNSYLCQQSHQTSILLVFSIILILVSCSQRPMAKKGARDFCVALPTDLADQGG